MLCFTNWQWGKTMTVTACGSVMDILKDKVTKVKQRYAIGQFKPRLETAYLFHNQKPV